MPYNLNSTFIYKSIRSDEYDFWRQFCYGIAASNNIPTWLSRAPLRNVKPVSGRFGLRIDGIYTVGKEKLFDKSVKCTFSKHQSCSIAAPKLDFLPPVFGHGTSRTACLVGVRFNPDHVLLQRIMAYDSGTISAGYRGFATRQQAEQEHERLKKDKQIFSCIADLIKHGDPAKINEVMARLKWVCESSSQICIFTDTLEARLLAQVRASDLLRHLQAQGIKLPDKYQVPISFYLPSASAVSKVTEYSNEMQQKDLDKGLIAKSSREKTLALFCKISANNFETFDENAVLAHLNDLLAIAAKLTYSSSDAFFKKIIAKIDPSKYPDNSLDFWRMMFTIISYEESTQSLELFCKYFPKNTGVIELGYLMSAIDNISITPEQINTLSGIMKKRGAEVPDLNVRLCSAAKKGTLSLVNIILANPAIDINAKDGDGNTALILAAMNGHADVVEALVKAKANLDVQNKNGSTALVWAAYHGRTDVVEALVKAKANLDVRDEDGYTALIWAACNGRTDVVAALVATEAKIDMQNKNGDTALMLAARNGHTDVVAALVVAEAKIDVQNKDGDTALIRAAKLGHTEVVKALVAAKANLNVQNKDGDTALREAKLGRATEYGHIYMVEHTDTVKVLMAARCLSESYQKNIDDQIETIINQAKRYPENTKKRNAVDILATDLEKLSNNFFGKPQGELAQDGIASFTKNLEKLKQISVFQGDCHTAINAAKLILNNPSWTSFFKNLALTIFGVGAVSLIYRAATGHYLFFKSKSEQLIEKTESVVEYSAPSLR